MPILVASGTMSSSSVSSWRRTKSTGTACTPVTPRVDCAVRAVMTLMAYAPSALMAFMSAWMPAPPLGSTPATVSTLGMMWAGGSGERAGAGGRSGQEPGPERQPAVFKIVVEGVAI